MTRAVVSVITPTYQRAELLDGAILDVRAQTYERLEHVIVVDGPDEESLIVCERASATADATRDLVYTELGRNWSSFLPNAYVAAPATVGMLLASGDYQMWLADDERMTPDHIDGLVKALERSGADFAYSRVEMYRAEAPHARWIIGTDPPVCGQITNVLYRAEVLKLGLYVVGDQFTSDWATIERWIKGGATWAFVDRVTLTHRADR